MEISVLNHEAVASITFVNEPDKALSCEWSTLPESTAQAATPTNLDNPCKANRFGQNAAPSNNLQGNRSATSWP
jgi:hypothetical protein